MHEIFFLPTVATDLKKIIINNFSNKYLQLVVKAIALENTDSLQYSHLSYNEQITRFSI